MNFDNIKKSVLTNKLTKPIVILMFGLVMVYYLRLFFTVGIAYEGQFLNKVTSADERIYTGSNEEGEIQITVQGIKNQDRSADVIYQLPDTYEYYTVWFKDASHWDAGIESITDIDEKIIFEGEYDKGSDTFTDALGEPLYQSNVQAIINSEFEFFPYSNSLNHIVDMVYASNHIIRGQVPYLIGAILLFIYTWIDYKFPLFFFQLSYRRAVYNPEPSEPYLFWQEISWYVIPFIGIVLMIIALYKV